MSRSDVLPAYLIHYDRPDWCVSAVASLQRSRGVELVLAVVDNGQHGGAPLASRLPADTRILRTPSNVGYAGGANLALEDWRARWPEADCCVIGSHDLHVEPDALEALLAAVRAHPDFGVLGPVLLGPFDSSGGVWTRHGARQLPLEPGRGVVERDWLSGTCLVVRAACALRVRAFDTRFGSYVEDVDFCLRARDAGWKVGSVREARAWGLGTASAQASALNEANTIRLLHKRFGFAAGAPALGRLGLWIARCAAGALAVWRPEERRSLSRRFLALHAAALRCLLLGPPSV